MEAKSRITIHETPKNKVFFQAYAIYIPAVLCCHILIIFFIIMQRTQKKQHESP